MQDAKGHWAKSPQTKPNVNLLSVCSAVGNDRILEL